ncbi:hypothetical protein CMV_012486 [Castanea mollissima]|uniref:Uncharacterized protein n=1 Tax=Castanea mollissima TaxID=60419 RepID=A0A8J4VMX8_9ROSI|nr:hypothetical protein CMV_012486 [Castanea mollissima]
MKLPHPQKRSVRPLFSILLLIVFAATVSFRAVLRRADVNLSLSAWSPQKKTHVLNFNSTLLKYASVDISEPRPVPNLRLVAEADADADAPTTKFEPTHHRYSTRLQRTTMKMLKTSPTTAFRPPRWCSDRSDP